MKAPSSPESLSQSLRTLAYNLWWTWNPEAQQVFQELSPLAWERSNHNAVEVLREISPAELSARLNDQEFRKRVEFALSEFEEYLGSKDTWSSRHTPDLQKPIAYFSAEFGLHESLPIYSGGLGILSGDHTKSASDLGLPFIAIGLFYRRGYFSQRIDVNGWQQESYPRLDPERLPLELVTLPEGGRLLNSVELGPRVVWFQTWRLNVGRTAVFLLDTEVPENEESIQGLTASVYGGDIHTRIAQEVVLGIGGVRFLRSIKIEPSVYHMNEGHSAFLALELLRAELEREKDWSESLAVVQKQCVFTTHTPVPAGHDRFPPDLMKQSLGKFWENSGRPFEDLLALGRVDPQQPSEPFTMTVLALKMSRGANGVSALHGQVSREMWQSLYPQLPLGQIPIGSITNGVHTPGWAGARAHEFWNKRMGYDWTDKLMEPEFWERVENDGIASDEELWALRCALRRDLVEFVRGRAGTGEGPTLLSPDALTICFARRFATYKRAPLVFRDLDRIIPIISDPGRPVQFVFSGKAHPRDNEGKRFIQRIIELTRHAKLLGRIVFVENYEINVARQLVAGADVWLNTPRRPLEASGTSGMKVLIHGGLNLSIMDGWWREAFNGRNGWAIGSDQSLDDFEAQDDRDFDDLLAVLTGQVIPEFYDRDAAGIPRRWLARMRNSMRTLIPVYSTDRMVAEYAGKYYRREGA